MHLRFFMATKKIILILGAGRSSSSLINYLLRYAEKNNGHVIVGDYHPGVATESVGGSTYGTAIPFSIEDTETSRTAIQQADVVISLLPAHFHPQVARLCLAEKKHLITASYVSDEMQAMHNEAKASGLLFMNECGLDPGIDHMTAKKVIDHIRSQGGNLLSFESFTGGLIAPETDPSNPWRYKFTWNPRNVVMAGQGTARFIQEGQYKFIPYQQLFKRITPVHIPGYGDFEGYANRDSLKYIDAYALNGIQTMIRGTLRNDGFCRAWNVFVQLGCTDDSYKMEHVTTMTHRDFINSFLPYDKIKTVEEKLSSLLEIGLQSPEMQKLKWVGIFDEEKIGLDDGTPAQLLEYILNKKWKLSAADKDMVVMWHRFVYTLGGKEKEIQSSLVTLGDNALHTAMAKGVGLPLGIMAKRVIEGAIAQRGVCIPVDQAIYAPVLKELESLGIRMREEER